MKSAKAIRGLGLVLVLDQATKFIVQNYGLVSINQGISFGVLANYSATFLLLVIPIFYLIVSVVAWPWWREQLWLYGLFSGSVLSNYADRMVFGGVRDWLPITFLGVSNNLADWVIFVCLVVLLYKNLYSETNLNLKSNLR